MSGDGDLGDWNELGYTVGRGDPWHFYGPSAEGVADGGIQLVEVGEADAGTPYTEKKGAADPRLFGGVFRS